MKKLLLLITLSLLTISSIKSQTIDLGKLRVDPIKEKMYSPYVEYRHGFDADVITRSFQKWKEDNKYQYLKELWYYSESFYVIHHVNDEGITIDESTIDISRFDSVRDLTNEVSIPLNGAGFNDTIVLLPINKLLFNLK